MRQTRSATPFGGGGGIHFNCEFALPIATVEKCGAKNEISFNHRVLHENSIFIPPIKNFGTTLG